MADPPPRTVGLLGGGVIGGGWAARFLLAGSDVRLYDPDPAAAARVGEMVENARRALGRLTLAPLPVEGSLTVVARPEDAVDGAEFVQESAPEDVELKREMLRRAGEAAGPETVFASSTSGLRPTLLQAAMRAPERFVVGHPFNPVYLLPLVEVCAGEQTSAGTVERARAVYDAVGMAPIVVRQEIDGFIADRLLEALWREALWLVSDGVATMSEIDDAIRLGAGLRWSFMGSFLTYRLGGGDAGMRHFIEQFGPALQWPWTKLTDVPELTDALIDTLVEQSDAQAGGRSVRELERMRDDCLVAVLQALRSEDAGAGAVLLRYERRLAGSPTPPDDVVVSAGWIDYNGHMHESRYLQVFGDATDALLARIGIDAAYLDQVGSYHTVETHLTHVRAAVAGQHLRVTTRVLDCDEKRLHLFHEMRLADDEELLATAEQMLLHVSAATGRTGPAGRQVLGRISELAAADNELPQPERAGRSIAMRGCS